MPKTEAELARFIQGVIRQMPANLPLSLVLQNLSTTQALTAQRDLTVLGRVFFSNLPTADPHLKGQLWSNAGVLTVSAG